MISREELAKVFQDTEAWYQTNEKLAAAVRASIAGSRIYKESDKIAIPEKGCFSDTVIAISKDKTFEAAGKLARKYPDARLAGLNFASATNPGGGVRGGSRAQEESLCRASTLYPVLNTARNRREYYDYHRSRHDQLYTDRIIYTPDIIVCKTDEDLPARKAEGDWFKADVITCAAPNLRDNFAYDLKQELCWGKDQYEIHLSRGRKILSAAVANKAEVLVLGAFGCGAFRNNPYAVARAYTALLKDEFKNYFRHVEFAIYCTNRETSNYETFYKFLNSNF